MTTKDTGGTAFPVVCGSIHFRGMTLRDYFAAKAMQAIFSRNEIFARSDFAGFAEMAYGMADKMLLVRGDK